MVYRWHPPRDLVQESNVYAFMEEEGVGGYPELVRRSTEDIRWFWGNLPEWLGVEWFKEPREVVDLTRGIEWASWYRGASFNLAYNVVDKPVREGLGGREAFTWVGEDGAVSRYTYAEFKGLVDRFANYLGEVGIGVGDVVTIYAPMMPESIAAMLASAKVGAIASPVFSGFAPPAVAERIRLAESRVVLTVDGFYRKGRLIRLKEEADKAIGLAESDGFRVESVVVVRRAGADVEMRDDRDVWFHEAISGKRPSSEPAELDPEHPALLLFTSGTTGRPKGALISHIGALLQPAKEHYFNLDIKMGKEGYADRLWWVTDIGWMMGPWQVIGAQFLGASHLMVEGALDHPDPARPWRLIEDYRVTHFGFAATVARLLRRSASHLVEDHDLSSIRAFGNTGEPIDEATWMWVMRDLGGEARPIINLSGGTEIFGCFLLPSPVVPLKPSTLWGPGLGMAVDVVDGEGNPVRGVPGYLVARKPAPSMTRGLWREPERYLKVYWRVIPGVWYHGDYALVDEEGFWYILGRADDVMNVAGKRIGSAEIESAITSHPGVAEAACVGVPHRVKGEAIACLITLRPGVEAGEGLLEEVRERVASAVGKPFKPDYVVVVEDLPRTRSGKITRRVIRDLAYGRDPGELSVIENPEVIEDIKSVISSILREG